MGYDAACTLRVGERATEGKAVLEQHDLVFRGPMRLAIPLKDITSAVARDGALTVRFGRRAATFELGAAAGRWAERITNPPSRPDKLGKAGWHPFRRDVARGPALRVRLWARALSAAPSEGVALARRATGPHGDGASNGAPGIRPKGSPAISESEVMQAGKEAGLVDVKVVSFSATPG